MSNDYQNLSNMFYSEVIFLSIKRADDNVSSVTPNMGLTGSALVEHIPTILMLRLLSSKEQGCKDF